MNRSLLTKSEFFEVLGYYDVETIRLQGRGNAQYLTEQRFSMDDLLVMEDSTYFMVYGDLLHDQINLRGLLLRSYGFEVAKFRSSENVWFSREKSDKWEARVCREFGKYKRWIDEYRSIKAQGK